MRDDAAPSARPALRVLLATPYGEDGMGGIDRLNDAIMRGFGDDPSLGMSCRRLVTRGKGSLWAAQAVFAAALLQLGGAALRREVDLLHIHLSVRGSSYRKSVLARAARLLGIPYVVHLHGTDYLEFYRGANRHLRSEIDRMLQGSVRIIVLGRYWAEVVSDIAPSAADRIVILPNATATVPRSAERPTSGPVRIVFLGQLGQRKGSADLLKALAELQDLPGWHATLAGDGAVDETRHLANSLGLSDRVSIPGWLSTPDCRALLAGGDVLVLPSYAENLPMVVLEAFAHGVPVITTPVGAIPEVVEPGRNGLLVTPGDITGLAAAIRQVVDDPELRHRMGEAARRDHATKFEIGRYLVRLSEIWRDAAAIGFANAEWRHADL